MFEQRQGRTTAAKDAASASNTPKHSDSDRATRTACNMLNYADRSEAKLRERLLDKGFDSAAVDTAVSRVKEAGLLNEQAQAQAMADYLWQVQCYGPARIATALYQKGYRRATVEAIDLSGADFVAVCQKRLCTAYRRQLEALRQALCAGDRETARALRYKLTAACARYGFDCRDATAAIEAALEEE